MALLAREERLGGFHFNNRKYADDDLIVGSVNPFELFLIFCELVRARAGPLPRLTIDQSHNVEPKVEAMVLSVVNLQEAYAKALLVDRDALAAAQEAGDVLGGHEILLDAYNTDVRPLCATVRARNGAAADPIGGAARVGLRGQAARHGRPAPGRTRTGIGPGSSLGSARPRSAGPPDERDHADRGAGRGSLADRPHAGRRPARGGAVRLAPARRRTARSRTIGGGNTSAKGTATDHVGREVAAMWVKGSGSDLATMSASDFTPLRLDEMLPLFERDAMTDEEMVAHLARCQLDPAAPRSSIETLLHAFIPAAHVHHTHPDAINVLACARDGARAGRASASATQAAWVAYIRPGFTLAKQVGEAVRDDPGLRLVVLAKHGLSSGATPRGRPTSARSRSCNRAAEFVNRKAHGRDAVRRPGARGRADSTSTRARETLR